MSATAAFRGKELVVGITGFAFGALFFLSHSAQAVTLTRGPYLQLSSPTNITICWRTDVPADSRVIYGTNSAGLTLTNDSSVLETNHFMTLTHLLPDTQYFYAVGTTEALLVGPEPSYYFLTHPWLGTEKPIRVWVIGDAGVSPYLGVFPRWQRAVRDAFVKWNGTNKVHAWLLLGDNAYRAGTDDQYHAAVFNVYPEQLRHSVAWPTLGNHDSNDGDTAYVDTYPYFSIFHLPTAGEAGGVPSGTEHFYSFDLGMVHFIGLDSMTADRSLEGDMAAWLRADLAVNTNRWTVAYWHHPPYSKGSHDSDTEGGMVEMRENIVPILEAAGVDLVLSGHSHSYERSGLINGHYGLSTTFETNTMLIQPGSGRETNGVGAYIKPDGLGETPVGHRGTVYTVVGCSGQTSGGTLNHPIMCNSQNVLGSLVLDFTSNRLDTTFLPTNGVPSDWFSIIKEGTYPPVVTNGTMVAPGIFRFSVLGRAFRTNIVEALDALTEPMSWKVVSTNISPTATFDYTDTNAATASERYYRIRRP